MTLRAILLPAAVCALATVLASGPTASAQVDGVNQVVDFDGDTVEATILDTSINFVPPLDGNPMSREWFHSGKAKFTVIGPHAKDFNGIVTLGYQVGYAASLTGGLNFGWSTPQLGMSCFAAACGPSVNNLLPTAGMNVAVNAGPGIQNVTLAQGPVKGSEGVVTVNSMRGSVNGVVGPTHIRPYVMVTSAHGDSVIAYGTIVNN